MAQDLLGRLRPNWEICGVVQDVGSLTSAVDELDPDLLILDVHIVGGSAFDALGQPPYAVPVIFTSGDSVSAVQAFECDAIDYILKPVRASRLERALTKLSKRAQSEVQERAAGVDWLTAHRGETLVIVHHRDILYLQSRTKYTCVVTREGDALIKKGLGQVEKSLDTTRFCRIHRSTIVSIDQANYLMRDDLGRMKLQLKGRSEWLFVSKPFEKRFKTT